MDLEGKWKAVLLGGLVIGLAPLVPFLNLACCLHPIAGGILAVAIYRSSSTRPLQYNEGATLGVLAGGAGTLIYAVLVVPVSLVIGGVVGSILRSASSSLPDVPPHVRPFVEWLFTHFGAAVGLFVGLRILAQLVVSLLFGTLGGLLGVALLERRR